MADNKFEVKESLDQKKVKVILDKPHTDAGVSYAAGDTIETDSFTARWLIENKIGKLA